MSEKTLYISLEQSVMVKTKKVHISDIAKIFCSDKDINCAVSKLRLFTFPDCRENQQVITVMKLIELIKVNYRDLIIIPVGETETIVYYQNTEPVKKLTGKIRAIILMIFAFFGTGYSIMSYNGDVGTRHLLEKIYILFTNSTLEGNPKGLSLGIIMYSLGLCIGMITFFNRGINNKNVDDPTPLQVQMRLYEKNVNQSIIIDSGRNKDTIDID